MSLRDSTAEITENLSTEIGARVPAAGVRVNGSWITHLAMRPKSPRRCCGASKPVPSSRRGS
jgi:hypothetical protein